MAHIKVLIVEDELIIAEDMRQMLREMEYEVIGITGDCEEAMELLSSDTPDIALIDIHLRKTDDGIRLAHHIRERYHMPLVFVTSYSDKSTVEQAKKVKPDGYIVKPFNKEDLYTSIEIVLSNFGGIQPNAFTDDTSKSVVIKDSIFIRKDHMLIKIRFEELVWIKSEQNYLELHCRDAHHLIRSTLKEFMEKLPASFIQVHKSYCINIPYLTAIDRNTVWLKETSLPIGRAYLKEVQDKLNLQI